MKHEVKETYTYAATPSLRKMAMKRAKKEGTTLSEIIRMAIAGYVAAEEWKDMKGKPLTPNHIILDSRPFHNPLHSHNQTK